LSKLARGGKISNFSEGGGGEIEPRSCQDEDEKLGGVARVQEGLHDSCLLWGDLEAIFPFPLKLILQISIQRSIAAIAVIFLLIIAFGVCLP
jgi:hypothetical protein